MASSAQVIVPEYLNESFLKKSLINEYHDQDLVIHNFEIVPATSVGDNYMSDVFRIHINFSLSSEADKTKKLSLVVKCMPYSGARGPVLEELTLYEKEVEMFVNVIPQLSKIANNEFFAAKCFYATRSPARMLVFHDLKSLNYIMANRRAGLDFDHCALIMKKIGKFHAASMPYAQQNMDLMNKLFHFSMFNPNVEQENAVFNTVFKNGLETLISVAENSWTDVDPEILVKLKKLVPVYVSKLRACLTQKFDDGYKVLNHGDLWCNNMLFKYDAHSGKVEDVVFVDYQVSYFSSPGIDLNYALSTCPNLETRDRIDELIRMYHESLTETLNYLKYPRIPTMEDLIHEIKRMEFFSLVSVVSVLPIVMMEKTDTVEATFETLVDEELSEKARRVQYSGKMYQAIVKPMLKRFNDMKILNI